MALRGTRPTRLLAARVGAYYLPMSLTGLRVLTPKAPKTAIPNASKRYEMRRSYRRSEDWKSRLLRSLWCSGKIPPAIRLPLLATFGSNCRSHWRSCYYCLAVQSVSIDSPPRSRLLSPSPLQLSSPRRKKCLHRCCQSWPALPEVIGSALEKSIHVPMPSSERHRTA